MHVGTPPPQLRSREEIEGIVEEAGIQLTPEQFEAVFGMSCEADGEEGRCCLDTWFRARWVGVGVEVRVGVRDRVKG